jgi:transcriptional regulator with XRE-family HTH domain
VESREREERRPTMKLTPDELKRIRREQGIDGRTMAERLGIAESFYNRVEAGERHVPAHWIDGRYWLFRGYTSVARGPR